MSDETNTLEINMPNGAWGFSGEEHPVETLMRVIGVGFGHIEDWCSKYGANYENDIFVMRRYSWAGCSCGAHEDPEERDHDADCELELPNFRFKPTGFEMRWYKYIGRDTEVRGGPLPGDFAHQVFASHPEGMKLDDALKLFETEVGEVQRGFREMIASLNPDPTP